MKKTLLLIITVIMLSLGFFEVYAEETLYYYETDTKVYLDGLPIKSYIVDGKVGIIAEELSKYGFSVNYIDKWRLLTIYFSKSSSKNITDDYCFDSESQNDGRVVGPIYHSDITVRIGSNYIKAYNIGGATIIPVDELNAFGKVAYYPEKKEIRYDYQEGWEYEIQSDKTIEENKKINSFWLEIKKTDDAFSFVGDNLNYLDSIKITNTWQNGMCFSFSLYQRVDSEAEALFLMMENVINENYEGVMVRSDTVLANKHINISINNKSVKINKISQGKGNGHVDYYVYLDCYMNKDEVENIVVSATDTIIEFSDIDGHWAKPVIEKWKTLGYINGYNDGTFKPDAPVTRAELAKILTLVFGLSKKDTVDFEDTFKDEWYYPYVESASRYISKLPLPKPLDCNAVYIQNENKNNFLPNECALRIHVAKALVDIKCETENIAVEQLSISEMNDQVCLAFKDEDYVDFDKSELSKSVEEMNKYTWLAYKLNIFTGNEGYFYPYGYITRAELLTAIDRVFK